MPLSMSLLSREHYWGALRRFHGAHCIPAMGVDGSAQQEKPSAQFPGRLYPLKSWILKYLSNAHDIGRVGGADHRALNCVDHFDEAVVIRG
jgi:hypothetical protein